MYATAVRRRRTFSAFSLCLAAHPSRRRRAPPLDEDGYGDDLVLRSEASRKARSRRNPSSVLQIRRDLGRFGRIDPPGHRLDTLIGNRVGNAELVPIDQAVIVQIE